MSISSYINIIKEEIWEPFKDHLIGIELWGSRSIEFINNQSDFDIILIYKSKEDLDFLKTTTLSKLNAKYWHEKYNFDIKFDSIDYIINNKSNYIYRFESNYKKVLFGNKSNTIENIFTVDEELLNNMKNKAIYCLSKKEIRDTWKLWYTLYGWLCCVNKKSFDLSDEEKENINILHDCKDGSEDLIKWCCEQLEIEYK